MVIMKMITREWILIFKVHTSVSRWTDYENTNRLRLLGVGKKKAIGKLLQCKQSKEESRPLSLCNWKQKETCNQYINSISYMFISVHFVCTLMCLLHF